MSERDIELQILAQPDDTTCGPTCLHAVYGYFGDRVPLNQLIAEIPALAGGGTLAVQLALHALRRGYGVTIYTYNLALFDPSWFGSSDVDLAERLTAQAEVKPDAKLRVATGAYLDFLSLGGQVRFEELTQGLLVGHLDRRRPILTGLSATYLYGCRREAGVHRLRYDDVAGVPTGHFVVLSGYDPIRRAVLVNDPSHDNPRFGTHRYWVGVPRLLSAILLGVMTYDANLMVLEAPEGAARA